MGQTVAMSLKEEFLRDGAVVLRGVVTPYEIELLTRGIDAVLERPSARAKVASTPDDPGFFIEDFSTWREHKEFKEFVLGTKLSKVAAELTGSSTIRMYHSSLQFLTFSIARGRSLSSLRTRTIYGMDRVSQEAIFLAKPLAVFWTLAGTRTQRRH